VWVKIGKSGEKGEGVYVFGYAGVVLQKEKS
jgi:hypothetical protein